MKREDINVMLDPLLLDSFKRSYDALTQAHKKFEQESETWSPYQFHEQRKALHVIEEIARQVSLAANSLITLPPAPREP